MIYGFVTKENFPFFVDWYELTMLECYLKNQINVQASFELFFRKLPKNWGYVIACGLEQACFYLKNLKFRKKELKFLEERGFSKELIEFLSKFKFKGDLDAVEEGELVFPKEPLLRIKAPITQAQFFETFLINVLNFQSLIATKASRVVKAAKGRPVVDFGSRRAHALDAGIKAARACYVAGCAGTSNVLAGILYGIPTFGTMAHSFIQVFPSEKEAFEAWIKTWGENTILLIDTYDTLKGGKIAAELAKKLKKEGKSLRGVRIDSGNILVLTKKLRRYFDKLGLKEIKIFVSSGLDEYKINELLRKGAKIDAFGVGTKLVVASDSPTLDLVYKLVEIEANGKMLKFKVGDKEKMVLPGSKQVFRIEEKGKYKMDWLSLEGEKMKGKALLKKIFEGGKLIYNFPKLEEIKGKIKENLAKLPEKYKRLVKPAIYPVELSKELEKARSQLLPVKNRWLTGESCINSA